MNRSDHDDPRVLLIGGTSHTGKSTVGHMIASRLAWQHRSTDELARHPGRPWSTESTSISNEVAEHYLSLDVDELVADVLRHYRDNVWPVVETLVETHATGASTDCLVLEGSAIWPQQWQSRTARHDNVKIVWLTADEFLIENRILENSGHESRTSRDKALIEKFVQRTLRYNEQMMDLVTRYGFQIIKVDANTSLDGLTDRCIELLTT